MSVDMCTNCICFYSAGERDCRHVSELYCFSSGGERD